MGQLDSTCRAPPQWVSSVPELELDDGERDDGEEDAPAIVADAVTPAPPAPTAPTLCGGTSWNLHKQRLEIRFSLHRFKVETRRLSSYGSSGVNLVSPTTSVSHNIPQPPQNPGYSAAG
jgi:hypothetical protein